MKRARLVVCLAYWATGIVSLALVGSMLFGIVRVSCGCVHARDLLYLYLYT